VERVLFYKKYYGAGISDCKAEQHKLPDCKSGRAG